MNDLLTFYVASFYGITWALLPIALIASVVTFIVIARGKPVVTIWATDREEATAPAPRFEVRMAVGCAHQLDGFCAKCRPAPRQAETIQ